MSSSTLTHETGSQTVEDLARRHPALLTVARLGWVAKGVVYALLGVLVVPIAVEGLTTERSGNGGREASQVGAVTEIAETSFGAVALWIIAGGLGLYIFWRLVSILLPAENTAKAWATRAGYLVSAVMYSVLAWTAVTFARQTNAAKAARARTPRSSASPAS
jgi:hypothetical protein